MNIQDHITKFNKKFCIDTFLTDRKRYAGNLRITEWLESALTFYAKQERARAIEDCKLAIINDERGNYSDLAIRSINDMDNQKDHD